MKTSSPLPQSDKFSTCLNPLKNLSFAFDQQSELNSQFLFTFFFFTTFISTVICQTCHILALLNFFIFFFQVSCYLCSILDTGSRLHSDTWSVCLVIFSPSLAYQGVKILILIHCIYCPYMGSIISKLDNHSLSTRIL